MRTILPIFLLIASLTINAQSPTFEWVKHVGGPGGDRAYSITTDQSGNIYTTGYFNDIVDFDPGTGISNLTSNGGTDIFIQKLGFTTVGIIENNFGNELLLYPNPTRNVITISLSNLSAATITLTTIEGRVLQQLEHVTDKNTTIDMSNLSNGLYFLRVTSSDNYIIYKVIKE